MNISTSTNNDEISDSKEYVGQYIHTKEKLPSFYMTKSEAKKKGWSGGSLDSIIEGYAIGGDKFGNYEGQLPKISGNYYECDINTIGKSSRGAERLIYNDDYGDIDVWYTGDHYESFELIYGDGVYGN